ncbi:MAG: trigger factor [Cyclobacteriaceae bacterium]
MEIALNKITSTEALIKIKLKEDDYQHKVDEKIKQYSKKANIKGFRQGMVPKGVIKKMYGKSIIAEEINELLSKKLNDYIKENDLPIITDPEPNRESIERIDWDHQNEFEFEYNIGMAGEYQLKPEKISVNRYSIKVDKKLIDETIDNLKKQHGEMTNPDESAEGDILFGDIKHLASETTNTHALDLEKIDKKERKKFIGLKKGDTINFELKEAIKDSHEASHLVGVSEDEYKKMKGDFEFVVKNVNRQNPAEITQEFFDKIFGPGGVSTEEEFRSKVEESIKSNYKRETESFVEKSIQKTLLDKTKIELPEEFLKSKLIERTKTDEELTSEYIEEHFDDYLKDIKWSLFQNRIIKEADLKVEHEEVVEKAKELIRQQFGASPQFADQLEGSIDQFAQNYLTAEEGKNYRQLYSNLIGEKVFDNLKEKVSIKEKSISAEDFSKLEL